MSTITLGVDWAKSVFSVCEVDGSGHVLRRLELKRDAFAVWLAQVPAGTVGNAHEFKQGRQMTAWLGLVPTQHSSGGHARLGGISCRGDAYLRTLLIQGARSSVQRANAVVTEKATPEQRWIRSLDRRLPFGKVIVAIANKHARQIWAMLAHDVDYDAHACLDHPLHQQTRAAHAA